MSRFDSAKDKYALIGVDVEKASDTLKDIPVSLHCWQGDVVRGFDTQGPLTGGIQTTGNYPSVATTPEQLMADMDNGHYRPTEVPDSSWFDEVKKYEEEVLLKR